MGKKKTTVSDFVIDFLVQKGISDIFLISGGGIMFLTDAVGRHPRMSYVANHHEQASAIAAEAYARVRNGIGACLVTTGPGGTNALTGVACAWFDSIPLLVISGQNKRELIADYTKIRNLGPQEVNIVAMAKPITKYAKTIMEPDTVRYELEKAHFFATTGRPGPAWLDIPLDVQGAEIETSKLKGYTPPAEDKERYRKKLQEDVQKTVKHLKEAKRPILILGHGIRLSGAIALLEELLTRLSIPVLLPFNAMDLVAEEHPLLAGKFGPGGQRRGNFALQNSDLVLSIGASLNIASIGFDYSGVAPRATKIMVNIDEGELAKPTIDPDLPIQADAKDFVEEFLHRTRKTKFNISQKWLNACSNWKKRYPSITKEFYTDKKHVNSYVFYDVLSDLLTDNDIITTGIGLDAASLYQAFKVRQGQRAFVNKNFGPMGWGLPGGIGACVGNGRKRSICIVGDGDIQVNIQELETIKCYDLPLKLFVFNNGGYESIRATQNNFFAGRLVGADASSGVTNPNFKLLAAAHSLKYEHIKNNAELVDKLKKVLAAKGPALCEVNISPEQRRMPKAASYRRSDGKLESKPLHDMFPFLQREEIEENMSMFKDDED